MSDFWLESSERPVWVPLRDVQVVWITKLDEGRWLLCARSPNVVQVNVATYPTEAEAQAGAVQLRLRVESEKRRPRE